MKSEIFSFKYIISDLLPVQGYSPLRKPNIVLGLESELLEVQFKIVFILYSVVKICKNDHSFIFK